MVPDPFGPGLHYASLKASMAPGESLGRAEEGTLREVEYV
jgi:hypothetical protein